MIEHRKVWFGDDWEDCPIMDRTKMGAGEVFKGPMIIEGAGGTSVVPPGWTVTVTCVRFSTAGAAVTTELACFQSGLGSLRP